MLTADNSAHGWQGGDSNSACRKLPLSEQFLDGRAGPVVKRVGNLDRPPDGALILFLPINPQRLVDGRVQIAHRDHAIGHIGPAIVARSYHLARLDATAGE